jgi:crotonobetainyl-CoA:carnitine CoA-transferase CaiB-like acyl-CoA transferase
MSESILPGCRVLDLTDEKGWFGPKLLADMGAQVIRIDPPGTPPPAVYANTGKHALSLDIESPGGRTLLLRLIALSDVIVESYSPGFLKSRQIDYVELVKVNPALILASITPFGQSGPSALKKSSDLAASASGGHLFLNGEADKPPLKPFGLQAYLTAGLFAANGVLLALRRRRLSGRGQQIDISIQECLAATLDHALVRYFSRGDIARRRGKLYWNNSFRLFPCRDGFVGLSFMQNWQTLVDWLDSEGLAADLKDARWQDPAQRETNIEHIVTILEKWTLTHTADELVELGQLMRWPWAKVARPEEVLNSPQLKARGYFAEVVDSVKEKSFQFPGAPLKMSGSPWQVNPRFPQAADYNLEIYHNFLGLSLEEIEKLKSAGTI